MLLLFPLSLECSSWLTLSPPQVLADMLPPYWSFTQFPSSKVDPNSYSLWFLPCFLLLHSTSQILHVFSYSFYIPSLSSEYGLSRAGVWLSSTCHILTQNSAWHVVDVGNESWMSVWKALGWWWEKNTLWFSLEPEVQPKGSQKHFLSLAQCISKSCICYQFLKICRLT